MATVKELAQQILSEYRSDDNLRFIVSNAADPLQAMILFSGVIPNAVGILNTPLYVALVEALDELL